MPFGRDTSGPEFVGDLVAFGRQDTQFGTIARLPLAPAARRRLAGLIAAGASLAADIVEIDRAVPRRSEGQAQAVLRLPASPGTSSITACGRSLIMKTE
ncbi:hypothetical protein [Tistrella mobilis]|uniref:hypothetical protein n=1 Tax=Tistrella mobilis TaxID=171437 RepID=UPI00059F3EE4|nr:hypothetical protein [Tistrella mobilis]